MSEVLQTHKNASPRMYVEQTQNMKSEVLGYPARLTHHTHLHVASQHHEVSSIKYRANICAMDHCLEP